MTFIPDELTLIKVIELNAFYDDEPSKQIVKWAKETIAEHYPSQEKKNREAAGEYIRTCIEGALDYLYDDTYAGADTDSIFKTIENMNMISIIEHVEKILNRKIDVLLPPGSDEASKLGCLCPIVDNHYGKGRGDGQFVMNVECPIHGKKDK